jgi:uncharacterized protein
VLTVTPLGAELRALGPSMLSQRAVHRFLGYLQAQLDRILGRHKGAPSRPELVARHGYDTKYASHALRLAHQGLEVLRDGRLTLPMPEPARERVRQVKRGEVPSLDEVVREIGELRAQIEHCLSPPATPRCPSRPTSTRSRPGR